MSPSISFSVWVKPDRFDPYNEIFRQEVGDKQILLSFKITEPFWHSV